MGRNPWGQNWWVESPEARLTRSQWLLRHVMLQSASLRRSSYDRPWRAADTVGGIVVRLAALFDTKLGSVVGQEHDDAADAKAASEHWPVSSR